MKKINKKMLTITSIVCLLPIIIGLFFYSTLPEDIAIHFDINNNPDGYFPKAVFVFGMPVIMLALQVFCCIVSDLADKNPEANRKAITVYKWIIPILSIVMYCVTILYSTKNTVDIRKIVMCILGMMLIIMGNYTPKTVGSHKLPKIRNEEVEKRMLRISGYILIINGIFCIISILFKPVVSVILISLLIIETIILFLYAINASKKTKI